MVAPSLSPAPLGCLLGDLETVALARRRGRTLEIVYERSGMQRDAVAEWQRALTLSGNPELAASIGEDYAQTGYKGVLSNWLEALKELATRQYV